jgi:hypothetical protein
MIPRDPVEQQGFEEHAAVGIAVVLQKALDGGGRVHAGIVAVEAELVVRLKRRTERWRQIDLKSPRNVVSNRYLGIRSHDP